MIIGGNRNFTADSRLTGSLHNFNNALENLRHLNLKEADQKTGMGAREDNFGAFSRDLNFQQIGADSFSLTEILPRDGFGAGQNRLGSTEINDQIPAFNPLH